MNTHTSCNNFGYTSCEDVSPELYELAFELSDGILLQILLWLVRKK